MNLSVNIETSPIKFGVFISPKSKNKKQIIELLYSVWCGYYCPILYYYAALPKWFKEYYLINTDRKNYYRKLISNFNIDVIIIEDELNESIISELALEQNLKVIKLSKFKDEVLNDKLQFGISLRTILKTIKEEEFKYKRNDDSEIIIQSSINNFLLDSYLGVLPKKLEFEFSKFFEGMDYFRNIPNSLSEFNSIIRENSISNCRINKYGTSINSKEYIIYLLSDNDKEDIIEIWNLRANGFNIIPIPIVDYKIDKKYIEIYKLIWEFQNTGFYLEVFSSRKFDKKKILKLFDAFVTENRLLIKYTVRRYPPLLFSDEHMGLSYICREAIIEKSTEQIILQKDEVSFNLPKIKFKNQFHNQALYKAFININFNDIYGKYSNILSGINSKDWAELSFCNGMSTDWRISNGRLIRFANDFSIPVRFKIPKSKEFFTKYFQNKGFEIKFSDKELLQYHFLQNIEGIYGTKVFARLKYIKLLSYISKKEFVTYEDLKGQLQKNKAKNPDFHIELLIEYKIIESGFILKCKKCLSDSFYKINEISDKVDCKHCILEFDFPYSNFRSSFKNGYRGIGLFRNSSKINNSNNSQLDYPSKTDGIISELMTIRFFYLLNDGFDSSSAYMSNILIDSKELDIAFILNSNKNLYIPELFIVECKNFTKIDTKDIERLKNLSTKFDSVILTFATLNNGFDANEKALLLDLLKYLRNNDKFNYNKSLLLLDADNLIPEDYFIRNKSLNLNYNYDELFFHYASDNSCKHHLGIATRLEMESMT